MLMILPDWFAQKASVRSLRFAPRTTARKYGRATYNIPKHLKNAG